MPQSYVVYLMRLWRASGEQSHTWRASLENPHTGERHGFADLPTLFAFLEDETAASSWAEPDMDEHESSGHMEQELSALATEKALYELIGRAITDAEFRARLLQDPQQATREAGYTLAAEQIAGLKASDLQGLAENLDERLSKRIG
jgi:hypothetical protein